MNYRCHNPNSPDYAAYGEKGITVSKEWRNDRDQFIEDMFSSYLEYEAEYGINSATIDRIDNSKGYSKDNCRWLTIQAQAQNKTNNLTAIINGKYYYSIGQVRDDYPEFKHHTLIYRHNRGWRDEELILPLKTKIEEYRAKKTKKS